jgi:multiple sugar transport system substrate-binding protein
MRTRAPAIFAILHLGAWLGCAPEQGPSLTIAVNSGVEGDALKSAAREWGARRAVRVELVELPYTSLFEKLLLDLTSRTGAYDVVMIDDPWFPRLAENGNLRTLDPAPGADFLESTLAVCREPYRTGPSYALPYVGNSQLYFYRGDLFRKHSLPPPRTWQDVLAAARTIGAAEGMYGYVMRAAPGNAAVTDFMALFWAFGAEMFSPEGSPAVASAEGVAALAFMLELGKYTPPGYAGYNADEVAAHLLQSSAVMSINWPSWISAMDDPAKSKITGKIEFTAMPSGARPGVASLGAWLLAIPAASRNAALAREFIVWATDGPQMREAALLGNPPTRRSVFLDEDLRKRFRSFPAQLASLETARPRPRTPLWNEIENAFGVYLSQANAGRLTAGQAMHKANREIAAILERAR